MLHILHDEIAKICPISCICELGNNNYRIDYLEQPTQEQIDQINELIDAWPLDKAKIEKTKKLDEYWNTITTTGWITPYGWSLGLQPQDVTLLTGAFILLKEASNMGLANTTSIIDTNGIAHELNLSEMTQLMLAYGQHRTQISQEYAAKKQIIQTISSISELDDFSVEAPLP